MYLQQLKTLTLDRLQMDDALALYAFGLQLQSTYDQFQIDTPDWLTENMAALKREVQDRVRDALLLAIKQDEQVVEGSKTPVQRAKEAQARIESRRQRLAEITS